MGPALAIVGKYRIRIRTEFFVKPFLQGGVRQVEHFGIVLLLKEEYSLVAVVSHNQGLVLRNGGRLRVERMARQDDAIHNGSESARTRSTADAPAPAGHG